MGTEDLIPPAKFTSRRSRRSDGPEGSHVCRRWFDRASVEKRGVVMGAVSFVVVLLPLFVGFGCLVKSWTMQSEVILVQSPPARPLHMLQFTSTGPARTAEALSPRPVAFVDECQVFTEQTYCSGIDYSWKVQSDGSYLCEKKWGLDTTLYVASYACTGVTPNAACALNTAGDACNVQGGDCVFTPAVVAKALKRRIAL